MPDSLRTTNELTPQNAPVLNGRCVFDIPRTADLEKVNVLFTGSLTLTTAAAGLITDGILNLITAVELLANSGRDVIATCPFNILVQGNMWRRKRASVPAITQPALIVAANTFSVAAVLDLAAFGTIRPKDTSLRENNYESLQLAFRFAPDAAGVYTGGGFVFTVAVLALTVSVAECIELPDAKGMTSNPVARPLITSNQKVIAGASNKVQYTLTPGQGLRGIVLRVTSNAAPPVLSDALLTRTRVTVGKVQRLDKAGATIKAEMSQDYIGTAAVPVGYYYLDFSQRQGADEHLNDVLNLDPSHTNGADSIIEFDTSGACTIDIMQVGYIPLAG